MTKKEFKEAMLRGLGRCVATVRNDPEKYRDIVLWACKRDISYDTQCESPRSWYVYTLASAYPDKETFIGAAEKSLKNRRTAGYHLQHIAEILMYFAADGCESARRALEDKYQEMLKEMFARKRRPDSIFCELFDLEQMGFVLAVDREAVLRVAGDFGRLYRKTNYLRDGDFCSFLIVKGSRYKRSLERAARRDEDIACFLQREQAYSDSFKHQREQWEQQNIDPTHGLKRIALSNWLRKQGDKEMLERYALAYREQTQPELREEALAAFSLCRYPDDPQPIIEDARSNHEALRDTAWRALEHIRHPAVREFALSNVGMGERTLENFSLLVTNYAHEDGNLLEEHLRGLIVRKDWNGVHWAGMDIYRAFEKDSGIPHPKHLLPLLYEYTPCSVCRESALAYMSRHRMLTKELLEECLFDSDDNIRRMAQKRLNQ